VKPARGERLGGRYVLLDQIAVGGMGEVWTAKDLKLHRIVALKVLREEYTGHQEFLRRLRTEARNSAALAHPNIAQMYDYGEEDGTGYLVMELVKGEPLSDLLERQKKVPPEQLLPILAQTARGLHHAHQNSVVHRDVKPGNILLEGSPGSAQPTVKITDFGVSLAANQAPMTATGMVMGTAQYLSPEQAIGKPATARSDIYALGIVAYEAISGKRPFTGKSPVDIAVAHVNAPVPPLPSDTDPALAALVMRMLSKEPATRPGDANLLAEELERLMPDEAVAGVSAGVVSRAVVNGPASTTAGGNSVVDAGPLEAALETTQRDDPSPASTTAEPESVVELVETTQRDDPGPVVEAARRPRQAGHLAATVFGPAVIDPAAAATPAPVIPPAPVDLSEVTESDLIPASGLIAANLVPDDFATDVVSDELAADGFTDQDIAAEPDIAAATVEPESVSSPVAAPQPAAAPAASVTDAKGRRIALAVLVAVFAILGLLLLIQALAGRNNAPVEPTDHEAVGVVTFAVTSSERSSHGG